MSKVFQLPRSSPPPTTAGPPVIYWIESELPAVVQASFAALSDAGTEIYGRGSSLVRPVRLDHPGTENGVARASGSIVLIPVGRSALVEQLTGVARFIKFTASDQQRPIACPDKVADTILARMGDWPFAQLRAVASAPTLRSDFSVLEEQGFDRQSGIYFSSDVKWPTIPKDPSREQATAALASLKGLLSGFPFVAPADLSGALALILTSLVRASLPTAPLFGVSAPTPGTGKSKLVDVAAILATGQTASVMSASREEAELKKQVDASLMCGDTFLALDNIEHPLRSEALCAMLTQSTIKSRVLGKSENINLPTAVTFTATGNSLRFAGDLGRRVVLISLDARVERPEERTFKTDAVVVARQRRVAYVVAGLTILRAYIASQAPAIRPALGSFEAWSNLVRSALVWMGEADPLENSSNIRADDPDRENTLAVLRALPAGEWRVADIASLLHDDDARMIMNRRHTALAEAVAEFYERGTFSAKRFAAFLRKHRGHILDGINLVRVKQDRNGIAIWRVDGRAAADDDDRVSAAEF